MTSRIGYIRNPRSTGGGPTPRQAADVLVRAPASIEALGAELRVMCDANVDLLIIDGGDGTIREVLSQAEGIWPKGALRYAIVASGNTNLIARTVGALPSADPIGAIRRGHLTERTLRPLIIERLDRPTLRGFIMGAGAYETVTRIAQQEIASRHGLQVAQTILKLVFSRALRAGATFAVAHDGVPEVAKPRMLFGLSSLPGKLIFGCEPFWNTGDGDIRWLDVASHPPALLLAAPFVAYGKPMWWMRRAYRSGSSHVVELTLKSDFVVDGECFQPGPDGVVRISATDTATFLAP